MTEPSAEPRPVTKRPFRAAALVATGIMAGALLTAGGFLLFDRPSVGSPFAVSGDMTISGIRLDCPPLIDSTAHMRDEGGATIAVGKVATRGVRNANAPTCTYSFTIADVPAGRAGYTVVLPAFSEPKVVFTEPVLRAQTRLQLSGTLSEVRG